MTTISGIIWNNPIYDDTNPLPLDVAAKSIKLMCSTNLVAIRDFSNFSTTNMVDKVAYVNPVSNINYMKIRTGYDNTSPSQNIDVVIIYHYMNHRNMWAVDFGFCESLVPDVTPLTPGNGNVNDATNPYVILARAFAGQIHDDLNAFASGTACVYDCIDHADPYGTMQSQRRITPIGELGWTLQNSIFIVGTSASTGVFNLNLTVETVPTTAGGITIPPGYYRAGDTQVHTTIVTTKN